MTTKHLTTAWLFLALLGSVATNLAADPPARPPLWSCDGSLCAPPPLGLSLPVVVNKIHDGDTATDVEIKLHVQVRYLDCWAPELKEAGGKESAASAKLAEGKSGRLFIPIGDARNLSDLFTFGRVVGEIWLDGASESESQRQVRLKQASTVKGGRLGK